MKKTYFICAQIIFGIAVLTGCSNDDETVSVQEEFLKAKVNGEEYSVQSSDIMECRKLVTDYGAVKLAVRVETGEGKIMEFLILNYQGAKRYPIGNRTYFEGNSGVNGNWLKYSETYPLGLWSTSKNEYISNSAFLEVTNDNGTYVSGNFSFIAQGDTGESLRSVSEGNFLMEFDR